MSLDKLDNGDTLRMTFRSNDDEVLQKIKDGFNMCSGGKAAQLTKQTVNVEINQTAAMVDSTPEENDFIDYAAEAVKTGLVELIYSSRPA